MAATITEAEKKANIAKNIVAREHEVQGYQVNIDNYTSMLAALPATLPENLMQYANLTPDQIIDQVPEADMQTVSNFVFRKKIDRLLKTEKVEQGKAQLIYNALVAQIPAEELDALLAAAIAV
mgnify:CR=1 FL=1